MCVLGTFRWLVFAYSTVTSNAIPVFYNSFECFQIFTRLYVRRKRIPNFWSKRSYALITKANLIGSGNIKISTQRLRNLLAFIITLADFAKSASYGDK